MSNKHKRAKPNTPEKYLWLRGQIFWFRHGVPKRFRSVETRKIIQVSLKTSDIRHASLLAGKMRADLHAEWEGRLKGYPSAIAYEPDNLELMLAATETAYLRIQPKLEQLVRHKKLDTKVAYDGYLKTLRSSRDHYLRAKASEPLPLWLNLADKQIQRRNWDLPKDSDSYRSFVGMIAEAAIEVISVELAKREGTLGAEPTSLVVKSGLEAKERSAEQGESILELFDRYAAYRLAEGRKRTDGVAQDRKVIESFASFVGCKRGVGSITPIDIRNWRDTLAALPPTYRKAKAYEGLSMQDAAAKAKSIGAKSISPVTQATAQKPWNLFWLSHGLHQGMSEAEFNQKAVEHQFSVKPLMPGSDTKSVKINDTEYWLLFCGGRLTYASWLLDNNDDLIKSLDERVNSQGFRLVEYKVKSSYNDATQTESNNFNMRYENPELAYSVTYDLFSINGQVTVEDSAYDDTYDCVRESS